MSGILHNFKYKDRSRILYFFLLLNLEEQFNLEEQL